MDSSFPNHIQRKQSEDIISLQDFHLMNYEKYSENDLDKVNENTSEFNFGNLNELNEHPLYQKLNLSSQLGDFEVPNTEEFLNNLDNK